MKKKKFVVNATQTIGMSTSCGDHIQNVAEKAKETVLYRNGVLHIDNTIIYFDFNDIKCLVDKDTNIDWLIRDYMNAHVMEWKQIGPACLEVYEPEVLAELDRRRKAQEEKQEIESAAYRAKEDTERKHPTNDKMKILGNVIRAGGDCTCPSPKSYVAQPAYDEELDRQLTALGYKKKRYEGLDIEGWDLNYGQIGKLCDEGKLTVDRYVDCYHIDDQIGLVEFAKAIASDCYKHCGNTQPSPDNTICLNCGSSIISEK